MKIHFAAMLGVDYDLDLSGAWVDYYLHRDFDSYTIILHRENGEIPANIISDYKSWGFRVLTADGAFNNGSARGCYMANVADNIPSSDILVTADCDEFQAMPDGTPINYHSAFNSYDILHGFFVDRYSDKLEKCVMDPFMQYPYAEEFTGEYFKTFAPPYINSATWSNTRRTKILGAPASYVVSFLGSHCVKELCMKDRILLDCRVIHFAWREGAARKMALKTYYTVDNLRELYGGNVPDGLDKQMKERKERFVNAF